jgi:hypothetical protein
MLEKACLIVKSSGYKLQKRWALLFACSLMANLSGGNHLAVAAGDETPQRYSVGLMLVGRVGQDPSLFHRIQSLFEPGIQFEFETAIRLNSEAVLKPDLPGRLYVWLSLRHEHEARIYVALREPHELQTRYLYRDVVLESGLDEIGAETLAQVAHSSALALWAEEQQVSRDAVESALKSDGGGTTAPAPKAQLLAARPAPIPVAIPKKPGPVAPPAPSAQIGLSAEYAARYSGSEGWLMEPGAGLRVDFVKHLSARLGLGYALPHEFDAPRTKIRLDGVSCDLRLGWRTKPIGRFRGRLDAGAGVFFAHWTAESETPSTAQRGENELRPFGLVAIGLEREFGTFTLAARSQLQIPLRTTRYAVLGAQGVTWEADTWLSPGMAVELRFPLD